jgi:hypothetical protein
MLFGRCLIECDLEAPKNKPIEKVGEIRDDTEQKVGSLQQILLKPAGSMLPFFISFICLGDTRFIIYDSIHRVCKKEVFTNE